MTQRANITFDPAEWSKVYAPDNRRAQDFVFAHGEALVAAKCAELLTENALVLDAGCGTGHLATTLAARGTRVIAIDYDPAMLHFARQRAAAPENDRVAYAAGDVGALPLGDDTCDAIVAVSLAGCLADFRAFLRESRRVLRRNGFLFVTFTNRRSCILSANALLRRLMPQSPSDPNRLASRLYDVSSLRNDFTTAGFTITDIRFYNFFLTLGPAMFPPRSIALAIERYQIARLSRHFARNFLVVARKNR